MQQFEFLGHEHCTEDECGALLDIHLALGQPAYLLEIETNGIDRMIAMPLWGAGALLIQ